MQAFCIYVYIYTYQAGGWGMGDGDGECVVNSWGGEDAGGVWREARRRLFDYQRGFCTLLRHADAVGLGELRLEQVILRRERRDLVLELLDLRVLLRHEE